MKINISNDTPSNIAIGSARSCYSSTLVTPEKNNNFANKQSLLDELFMSGHHTTMQHTVFTFEIDGISRLLIWRLLHSHAHYNSDQVSQRYAKVKPGKDSYYYPKSVDDSISEDFFLKTYEAYFTLTEKLTSYFEKSENKVVAKAANKKAMELARYVLPQAVKAHLYHSINLITALRYIKAAEIIPEAETEAKELAEILKEKIIEIEPSYSSLIEDLKKQKVEFPEINLDKFPSLLNGENVAVFDVNDGYGFPNLNNYSAGINTNVLFYPMEAMSSFSMKMKLSLSADAQNQRHRTSIGIRPELMKEFNKVKNKSLEEIFYIPKEIKADKDLYIIYTSILNESISLIAKLSKDDSIDKKDLAYFLPNAFLIEIVEKNDMVNFTHKAKLRTCLNSQEEIRDLTESIISKLKSLGVAETEFFVPPCVTRFKNKIFPTCSEGKRFCGVKVWKLEKYNN